MGVGEGVLVKVESNGASFELNVVIDNQLAGDICYIPTFDKNIKTCTLFSNSRYAKAVIKK